MVKREIVSKHLVRAWKDEFERFEFYQSKTGLDEGSGLFVDASFDLEQSKELVKRRGLVWRRLREFNIPVLAERKFRVENIKQGECGTCALVTAMICLVNCDLKFNLCIMKNLIYPQRVRLHAVVIAFDLFLIEGWDSD
jgi:hypothetical protein